MPQSLEIVNSTDYIIRGEVTYMTIFCTSHYFFVKPSSGWKSEKRGIFPIIQVSAEIHTPRGIFTAKPYISVGTNYNRFEVVELRENVFKVVRKKNSEAKKLATINTYEQKFLEHQ